MPPGPRPPPRGRWAPRTRPPPPPRPRGVRRRLRPGRRRRQPLPRPPPPPSRRPRGRRRGPGGRRRGGRGVGERRRVHRPLAARPGRSGRLDCHRGPWSTGGHWISTVPAARATRIRMAPSSTRPWRSIPPMASAIPSLATPEWIDHVSLRASVEPAPFHDGSILTAHDMVFSYDRAGGVAEYHQGGATTDHTGGWTPTNPTRGAESWVRNEAVDDRTWSFELAGPDGGFFAVNLARVGEVAIYVAGGRERRGDAAVDQADGHGPLPLRQPNGRRRTPSSSASRTTSSRSTTPSWCRTTPTTST